MRIADFARQTSLGEIYDSGIRTWRPPVGPADGLFSVRTPVARAVLAELCKQMGSSYLLIIISMALLTYEKLMSFDTQVR